MSTPSEPVAARPAGARQFLLVWGAVALAAALAHFAFAPRMGLYEDDHWLIGVPMCEWNSPGDVWAAVRGMFAQFFQGRPMHYGFGFALAYAGTHAGGLLGAYVLAGAVWALNAGLCLALLWKRFGPPVATVAALVFVLMPADSTHPMLHTAFFVHPSLTFLLLSGIAYSRGRRLLAVPLSAVSLITYEPCFFPALAWPILFCDFDRALWRRLLVHGALMGAVLGLAVFLRVQFGESRVAGAMSDKSAVAKKVGELAVVGPRSALQTFIDRPRWVAKTWQTPGAFSNPGPGRNTTTGVALAVAMAALAALIVARRAADPADPHAAADAAPVGRLLLAGAAMVVLSYVASVTRAPEPVNGRLSSVHIGSTLGWAVLFGGLAAGAGRLLNRTRLAPALLPLLALYFGFLAAFHVYVQREYVRAWVAQGEFWRDLVAECPDVGPGTVILYPLVRPTSEMVRHQEWADYMVFRHLFVVPADWAVPPRAYPIGHGSGVAVDFNGYDWNEIERDGDRLFLKHWDGGRVPLEPGNVIVLKQLPDGRHQRVTGAVRMRGIDLPLKETGGPAFAYPPHALHRAMFPKGTQPETHRRVSK